jgi:exodeoxyribonuclease V alpha subunit
MTDITQRYSRLDRNLAEFLGERSRLTGEEKTLFVDLVARLSSSLSRGNSCLPVSAGEERLLGRVHLVSGGEQTPLVLKHGRLYLHRYYRYETLLSRTLADLAGLVYEVREDFLKKSPVAAGRLGVQQLEAATLALTKGFSIISGGPGTGKTTAVVGMLTLLLEQFGSHLRIALSAPTGKAAVRLAGSVAGSLRTINPDDAVAQAVPDSAFTLHRLLGYTGTPRFRHNGSNPMSWDVVVVDEASMVDLAMMSKLVEALKPGARLILLGDKDQLASVESGAVLADLMAGFPDNSIELTHTYRFDENIKRLAYHINSGDSAGVWGMLDNPEAENVSLIEGELAEFIGERYVPYMKTALDWERVGIPAVFREFGRFQVLCAVHFGRKGVEGLNSSVETHLSRRGFDCRPGGWYPGRPLLITRNDYTLGLFNGDVGICLPDGKTGSQAVHFPGLTGGTRAFSMGRLPPFETVYCMTIHKSQGSEFEHVMVVLPDQDNQVLCRELVYTGVTRAKQSVSMVVGRDLLERTLQRTVSRDSGLRRMLHQARGRVRPAAEG